MIVELQKTSTGVRATYKNKVSKLWRYAGTSNVHALAISEVVGDMFNLEELDFYNTFSENAETEVSQFYTTSTGIALYRILAKRDK